MRTLLFNPGPTNVHPDVKAALVCEDLNHRDARFLATMHFVCSQISELAGGNAEHACIPFASSGTGGCEAVLSMVTGKVLVLSTGRYGRRLGLISQAMGLETIIEEFPPLQGIDIECVAKILARNRTITHMAFAHHETTTTILAPLRELCGLAKRSGVTTIVDAVSSLYGHDVDLVRDNIDIAVVSSNKCLEALPGLAFVLVREALLRGVEGRSRSFYFDIAAQWRRFTEDRLPRFTMPIQLFSATKVAINRLQTETVSGRASRYLRLKQQLREGLPRCGLGPANLGDIQTANQLLLVDKPAWLDYQTLCAELLNRGIAIYTDPDTLSKGYLFFATMGAIDSDDIECFLGALEDAISAVRPQARRVSNA